MNRFLTRFFDLLFSTVGLMLLFPLFAIVSLGILFVSGWPVLYFQTRVGKGGRPFRLVKFRTMNNGAEHSGQLTVGGRDPRITPVGYILRKYKLDELPQLWHVLSGTMSLVGPRPEVQRYVDHYTEVQRKVLSVRPGITDEASIAYANENELLSSATDPEKFYREVILPDKIRLNMFYINDPSVINYFKIIGKTFFKIIKT